MASPMVRGPCAGEALRLLFGVPPHRARIPGRPARRTRTEARGMHFFYDLTGKVALVTGGGGAIGGASARALARAGADVIIVDLRPDAAEEGAGQVRGLGRKSHVPVGRPAR